MLKASSLVPAQLVVPRKGDVDRNTGYTPVFTSWGGSSPARGTWIEMVLVGSSFSRRSSRPPQGGRG